MSKDNTANSSLFEFNETNENRRRIFDRNLINIEPHQLLWLNNDSEINNNIASTLRSVIDYVKFFDNVTECQDFLDKTNGTHTFLILSVGQFMQDYISLLHEYDQIKSIYILHTTKENIDHEWISNFRKVKRASRDLKDLSIELSQDVNNYLDYEQNDGLFTSMGEEKFEQSTDINHQSWWQYLIDFLASIDYPNNVRRFLINDLKCYYNDNNHELTILQEFEHTYTPNEAIRWYTRPTFVYRLINRALRQRDVPIIFRFGFFLKDLYQQLKQLRDEHIQSFPLIIKCYRGQVMSTEERERIINSSMLLTQTNSLLSASLDRDISLLFLQPDNHDVDSVLFEIEINTQYTSHPYANIKQFSYIPDEDEILFAVGTIFDAEKKNTFYDEKQNIWYIKLSLYNDEHLFQANFQQENRIQEETKRFKHQLNQLIKLTYQWSYDDLNEIFQEIINLFPTDQWISAVMYKALGKRDFHTPIYSQTHGYDIVQPTNAELYDRAIRNYENGIEIWQKYLLHDQLDSSLEIAQLHRCILQVYRITANQQLEAKFIPLAMEYNRIVIRQTKKTHNYLLLVSVYENCARTYYEKGCNYKWFTFSNSLKNQKLAIKYSKKKRDILRRYLPDLTKMLADCLIGIAEMYDEISKQHRKFIYKSFKYYKKALKIYLVQPSMKINASIISNISNILAHRIHLRNRKNCNLALKYQLISTKYTLIANSPMKSYYEDVTNIAKSYQHLARFYERVNQYDSAIETLLLAIETYEKNGDEFCKGANRQSIEYIRKDIDLLKWKRQIGWKYNSKTPPSPDLPKAETSDDKSGSIEWFDEESSNDTT